MRLLAKRIIKQKDCKQDVRYKSKNNKYLNPGSFLYILF